MARREITKSRSYQVTKEALKYYNEHYQDKDIDLTDAFEAGAKWADNHPKEVLVSIDKVCAYLEMRIDDYIIRDLRKAMEE